MRSPFSFEGELDRRGYALRAIPVFLLQYAIALAAMGAEHVGTWRPGLAFWISPLRVVVEVAGWPRRPWVLSLTMIAMLAVTAVLVALAFRRARQAHGFDLLAAFSIVPVLQGPAVLCLCLAPPLKSESVPGLPDDTRPLAIRTAVAGLLIAAALGVGAVALSTLAFGVYGMGLFLASPFVIGLVTAYVANRRGDISMRATWKLVGGGLLLAALALLGFAFEGVVCLVLASPLIAVMGLLGALLGRAWGLAGLRPRNTVMSIAIAPLLMLAETVAPPHADFESVESIAIAATPDQVWDSVVHMGPIPGAPAVPFRWGLAYPMRGEIVGQGVGAVRRGVFSTGVAYERVTAWDPGRELDFVVLSDPPTMRELSPYSQVNAPHVQGYFRTRDARFTITPLGDGRTRLTLATHHDLDLEPAPYWLPLAEWATHANKVRVLAHFRDQAETAARR